MSQSERHPTTGEDTLAQVLEGDAAPHADLTGTTVGDFHVERLLGRGGMGEVYLATQLSLRRPVALKVLRPDVLSKPGYRERFESEAIAVAKLNHPSIVHVYSMGQVGSVYFIAMEYVEGITLREYVAKRGAMDLAQALSVMKQTAQAIGAAGEAGIIHRDVKPENILITRRGRVKVADFGLCRQLDDEGPQITQVGITMGTPAYMSPEQAQGHPLDHRSDLYSLGATYYFMLAGTPPFRGESPVTVALKHIRELPSSLLAHRPDLPVEVDRLVMKLMAKDPADRYQSAAEMLADLARLRETVPLPPGARTAETVTFNGPPARTEASGPAAATATASGPVAAPRVRPSARAMAEPTVAPAEDEAGSGRPAFSGLVATVVATIGLCAGALAAWAGRAPDVQAIPDESARRPPGLWLDPRWAEIPRQSSAEDQVRYAQFAAPRDRWAAAWLAVPGHHPRSHDAASRAYAQVARLWYREGDLRALSALGSGLSAWKDAQRRDRDLAALIRRALDLKRGDLGAVEKAFGGLNAAEVADMYEPTLVALNVEVCADALKAVQRTSGTETIARPLQRALTLLVQQLQRIEVGGGVAAAARANGGGAAAPRAGG